MPPRKERQQTESTLTGTDKMEETLKYIQREQMPDIYKQLNKLNVKVACALILWGFNLAFMTFISSKVFQLIEMVAKLHR